MAELIRGVITIIAYVMVIFFYAGVFYVVFCLLGYQACYTLKLGLGLGSSVLLINLLTNR